jgi:alpha-ketoglutarate-dependent 2,4-dichlorophenoxyacetate dioxygenase
LRQNNREEWLRDQDVTNDIQLASSRRFGPPELTKVGSDGAGTHFMILTTIGADRKVVPAGHRTAMRNKANQLWHTDRVETNSVSPP